LAIKIMARNYRGFKDVEVDVSNNVFITGDNSSGKSSLLLLLSYVLKTELTDVPKLDDSVTTDSYDFFSPYFNFADVDVGFITTDDDGSVGKAITIKRPQAGAVPYVSRMTWVENGNQFTFKWSMRAVSFRMTAFEGELTPKSLFSAHDRRNGFTSLTKEDDVMGYGANSSDVIYHAMQAPSVNEAARRLMFNSTRRGHLPMRQHSGPLRGLPERFYNLDRKIKPTGTHFASMWHDMTLARAKIGIEAVKKFGRESSLFEDISVDRVSRKIQNAPLMVTVVKQGKKFLLSQVGVGVSQVIPIVVESAFYSDEPDENIILLQQPELHLHPVAQAALGEFLYAMAKGGVHYVIETHSDYLIDRFRANMREDETISLAHILFCENTEKGNVVTPITISKGEIVDPPQNYKDFFVNELMRTMF